MTPLSERLAERVYIDAIVGMDEFIDEIAALESRIEALWKHCHIVYWPPGQPLAYPIEHNLAAKKDNRRAIEAAIAAEAVK